METTKFKVRHSAKSDKHVDIWYVADVKSEDINAAVYEAFKVVAQKVLDWSTCSVTGDYTAAELAGKVYGSISPVEYLTRKNCPVAPEQCIRVAGFSCHFYASDIFQYMAEWEGVAEIKSKDIKKFHCEAKGNALERKALKKYQRTRCYKPTTISLAAENRRIAMNLKGIGQLSTVLNAEGMRKAFSLLKAIQAAKGKFHYKIADEASEMMRRWHWEAFRKVKDAHPQYFEESDFRYAPDEWQKVDEAYVAELLERFETAVIGKKTANPEQTLSDRLRDALRRQLGIAA